MSININLLNMSIKIQFKKNQTVVYFEIPVIDIDRATKFYSTVFNFKFDTTIIDNCNFL